MAKRFTDTEKWRDEWWGSLNNDYRMVWLYLIDSCSIAGIWKKDFRGLNFNCNTNITEEDFLKVFSERVIDRGTFFFIPKFIRFQCPKGLNSNKPAILSIVRELQLNNLTQTVNELFGNDYLIIKDKDKGKDKGKEKGKDTDKGKWPEEENKVDAEKLSDLWFAAIFDSRYLADTRSAFREHDIENELKVFKLKVRGSPKDYQDRDTGGIRQAFIYQLTNSKPKNGTRTGNKRTSDAIIESGREFGKL